MHQVYCFFYENITVGDFWPIPSDNKFFLKVLQRNVMIWRIVMFQLTPDTLYITLMSHKETGDDALHDIWNSRVQLRLHHEFLQQDFLDLVLLVQLKTDEHT